MLQGITSHHSESVSIYIIESFTNEIKSLIRKNLTAICHGSEKAIRKPRLYSYNRTLKDFMDRYETKTSNQKLGMIGELLAHVFILSGYPNLKSVNPFFNMEEKNVKKGFDLILVDEISDNKLWITEVKSGQLGSVINSKAKNRSLLNTAKKDLNVRLNENDQH